MDEKKSADLATLRAEMREMMRDGDVLMLSTRHRDAIVRSVPALLNALNTADHAMDWEDVEDEWSADVAANHPTRNDGAHQHYATAMRMVGHRHSKGQLVSLVSWLLVRIDALTADNARLRADVEGLSGMSHTYRCENSPGCSCCACERDKLRAENEALRPFEEWARRDPIVRDGHMPSIAGALARLDALRKEKA